MLTRVFQSGNSIAVRIPKELAIVEASQDVEIERVGDSLVIRPIKRRKLSGLGKLLGAFSTDFMASGREPHEQAERDWGDAPVAAAATGKRASPSKAGRRGKA